MVPYRKLTLGLGSAARFLYQLKSSHEFVGPLYILIPSYSVSLMLTLTFDSYLSFHSTVPKYVTEHLSALPTNIALSYLPALERQRTLNVCLSWLPLAPSLLPSIYTVLQKRVLFTHMARLFEIKKTKS